MGDTTGADTSGQGRFGRISSHFAKSRSGALRVATVARGGNGPVRSTKNAPSRWRLRPAFRLTAAEATASRRTINLRRSVLGASRTLGLLPKGVKAISERPPQIAGFSFRNGSTASCCACSRADREEKRAGHAGPAGKSSPSRERFRPPSRPAFRFRVVLIGGLRPTGAPISAHVGPYGESRPFASHRWVRKHGRGYRLGRPCIPRSRSLPSTIKVHDPQRPVCVRVTLLPAGAQLQGR